MISFVNHLIYISIVASMRLCMGSRRGFICRMRLGQVSPDPLTSPPGKSLFLNSFVNSVDTIYLQALYIDYANVPP